MNDHAVRVTVTDESDWPGIDADRWASIAHETLIGESVQAGNLDVMFVDKNTITELNREHMGKRGPTDVLSFPLDDPFEPDSSPIVDVVDDVGDGDGSRVPLHIGDVVVCPEVAAEQAPDHCGDVEAELTLLIVHGVLHVLGHDHAEADEAARMLARETVYMSRYGFDHPGPMLL